jgi:hypothetical protein
MQVYYSSSRLDLRVIAGTSKKGEDVALAEFPKRPPPSKYYLNKKRAAMSTCLKERI